MSEPPPRPLETALGTVWGPATGPPSSARSAPAPAPRSVLETIVERALRAEPCMVSFSGGRDSSAILAVATHVARRSSLPMPVPVTLRFPHDPLSEEAAWQELVIHHLGLREWIVLDLTDELDLIGSYAQRILVRFGARWPFNLHFHVPIADLARGGALLTGIGGDELFGRTGATRVQAVLHGRVTPTLRDARRVAHVYGPRRVRARAIARAAPEADWLRPGAAGEAARQRASWLASKPARWDRSVTHWWARSRMRSSAIDAGGIIGMVSGTEVNSPFLDDELLLAVAAHHGAVGPESRTVAMRALVGDLLPDAVLARGSKAGFLSSFWGPETADFGRRWTGAGADPDIVDVDALRTQWGVPLPAHAATFLLLQSTWLAAQG